MATNKYAYIVYRDYRDEARIVRSRTSLARAIETAKELHASGVPSGESQFFTGPDVCAGWQPDNLQGEVIRCQGQFEYRVNGLPNTNFCSVKIKRIRLD